MSDLLDQMVAWWRYSDQVAENPFVGGAFRRCADELSAAKPAIVREIQADPTWLAREILRARIEEAKWWAEHDIEDMDTQDQWDEIAAERCADLKRQLAELVQVTP